MITAILPVSRYDYLYRVLDSFKAQTVMPDDLIIIHESNVVRSALDHATADLGIPVRIFASVNPAVSLNINDRRKNITNIHNQFKDFIEDADYVFSIEDDGILPSNALEALQASLTPEIGFSTGVELGRWQVPYVGAWTVDDIHNPQQVISLTNKPTDTGVEEIDGAGLYCALIRADVYTSHTFIYHNGLGPDINLGLHSRQLGYRNIINWGIHVTHLTEVWGLEAEVRPTDVAAKVQMDRQGSSWSVSRLT